MGLLGKLLKKPSGPQALTAKACTHRILLARWEKPEDAGQRDRIAAYKCEACDELFTAAMGHELMNMA